MNIKKENIFLPGILVTGICVLSLTVYAFHGEEILKPLLAGIAECIIITIIFGRNQETQRKPISI